MHAENLTRQDWWIEATQTDWQAVRSDVWLLYWRMHPPHNRTPYQQARAELALENIQERIAELPALYEAQREEVQKKGKEARKRLKHSILSGDGHQERIDQREVDLHLATWKRLEQQEQHHIDYLRRVQRIIEQGE